MRFIYTSFDLNAAKSIEFELFNQFFFVLLSLRAPQIAEKFTEHVCIHESVDRRPGEQLCRSLAHRYHTSIHRYVSDVCHTQTHTNPS